MLNNNGIAAGSNAYCSKKSRDFLSPFDIGIDFAHTDL